MRKLSTRLLCCLLLLLMLPMLSIQTVSAETADDPWPFGIRNGSRDDNRIAITVDDCYSREWVRNIFDLCVQYQVGVTFFPVGDQLFAEDADLWREIAASPYAEIGSHTQHHAKLMSISDSAVITHLSRPQEVLDEVLGTHYQINATRPPFGNYRDDNGSAARMRRLAASVGINHMILWDVSQTDPAIAIKQVKNGSILLYHTKHKDYVCLETLIPALLEKGFVPVTVSELLGFPDTGYSQEPSPVADSTATPL